MTRCVACDKNLNDYESTRKDLHGAYLDMCNRCYYPMQDIIPTVSREDLSPNEEVESEIIDRTLEWDDE